MFTPIAKFGDGPNGPQHMYPLLVRIEQASEITGIPESWLEKSFMNEPPKGAPPPPPHTRIGTGIYIITALLPEWVLSLKLSPPEASKPRRGPGRPTKAMQIANRQLR